MREKEGGRETDRGYVRQKERDVAICLRSPESDD